MNEVTNEKIDSAIEKMSDMAKASADSQKSLHYSQAALNLAHTKSVLSCIPIEEPKGKSAK